MIDDDCGAIGGMRIGRGNPSTRRKPAPEPLCPPQIPYDLAQARTRAAAVGNGRLRAWAMACPGTGFTTYIYHLHQHQKLCNSLTEHIYRTCYVWFFEQTIIPLNYINRFVCVTVTCCALIQFWNVNVQSKTTKTRRIANPWEKSEPSTSECRSVYHFGIRFYISGKQHLLDRFRYFQITKENMRITCCVCLSH
jgi:hypothetical protein